MPASLPALRTVPPSAKPETGRCIFVEHAAFHFLQHNLSSSLPGV